MALRPRPEDWHDVHFSDESHFGFGDPGRTYISRRRGAREAYKPENLQEQREPNELDKKCLHVWGAVGYNFKSELVFYTVPSNRNGKIT